MKKITIASFTATRSEFERFKFFYTKINSHKKFDLSLAVGASHLNSKLGSSISSIKKNKIKINKLISFSEDPAEQSSIILKELYQWLIKKKPNAIILTGDKYEMLSASQAATLAGVPIIHVGGGHITSGAIDDRIRNAITKLSALHLTSGINCTKNVILLNENKKKVFNTGAAEIEGIYETTLYSKREFYNKINLKYNLPFALVTFHSETNASKENNVSFSKVAYKTLKKIDEHVLISAPAPDPYYQPYLKLCNDISKCENSTYIPNLGFKLYISAMKYASYLLGNSSSGIIESASIKVPVVNVGSRQKNRERAVNVVDCEFNEKQILNSIKIVKTKKFRKKIIKIKNPYGDGKFSRKAIKIIENIRWPLEVK